MPLLRSEDVSFSAEIRRGVPRALDVHEWMAEEDKRRDDLFQSEQQGRTASEGAKRRRRNPLEPASLNIAYRLATSKLSHAYACGACSAWIARPCDIIDDECHPGVQAADLSLDDSANTICAKATTARDAEAYEAISPGGRWRYGVCAARCPECSAFLGVKVRTVDSRWGDDGEGPTRAAPRSHTPPHPRPVRHLTPLPSPSAGLLSDEADPDTDRREFRLLHILSQLHQVRPRGARRKARLPSLPSSRRTSGHVRAWARAPPPPPQSPRSPSPR